MVEPIFFLYIFVAIFSYGLHSPLLVLCSRKHNPVVVSVYRNLSYVVTMSPLLLFVSWEEVAQITDFIHLLVPAALFASAAFMLNMTAAKYLPVGIGACLRHTASIFVSLILGYVLLHEYLTFLQIVLLGALLTTVLMLTLIRNNHAHLDPKKAPIGFAIALASGLCAASAFFFFSKLAQVLHPFVAGFFWEVSIGFVALGYMLTLAALGIYKSEKLLPAIDLAQIALFATPAIAGTIFYGLAVNNGPYILASGLSISAVAVGTLVSWFLFKEKLNRKQLLLIGLSLVIIFTIRISS